MQFPLTKNKIDRLKEDRFTAGDRHRTNKVKRANLDENNIIPEKNELAQGKPFYFQTIFQGHMEMYCDRNSVAKYLDRHQDWFVRCAKPMTAIPLGEDGYILTVGRFGSFGYEVEAKIGVVTQSLGEGQYVMNTVEIPNYQPPGYEVDYQASLQLSEIPTKLAGSVTNNKKLLSQLPNKITIVEWQLNLAVAVKFPKFIHKLPSALIQTTGDRLLTQIVRQVSPLLSCKVQKDFHSCHNLPVPNRNSRGCQKIGQVDLLEERSVI